MENHPSLFPDAQSEHIQMILVVINSKKKNKDVEFTSQKTKIHIWDAG